MQILPIAIVVLAALTVAPARAQSLNIRASPLLPVPSQTYGAATGQAGTWNWTAHEMNGMVANTLVDLAGNPTAAKAFTYNCDYMDCAVTGYGPEVAALFGGFVNGDCYATPSTTWISGLLPGHYEATLYGTTCVSWAHTVYWVGGSGSQIPLTLSGTYDGSFAQMQLGFFSFDLSAVGTLQLVGVTYGSWCALQLTHFEPTSSYCTAKLNSLGCTPAIGWTGTPSAGATSGFTVGCSEVLNQKSGLLLYKVGGNSASMPFQGGTLCVGPSGVRRTPGQSSSGSPMPAQDCSGGYSIDLNAFAHGLAGGNPDPALLGVGSTVRCQWWGRDPGFPAPDNTMLSDALEYHVRS